MAEAITTPASVPMTTPTTAGSSNLLTKIKSNLQAMTQPTDLSSMYGQSGAVQSVSQAATGKLGQTAVGPARSRQAELAAVSTAQQAQKTISDKAQLQTTGQLQQMEAIQADEQFKQSMMSEEQINSREKLLNIKQDILKEYTSNARQLDINRDKAKLEQLGFSSRLASDTYLNELQKQAKLANLGDELSFNEHMLRAAFSQEESLFRSNLEFRQLMAADERSFREELANMNRNFAIEIAEAQNEADQRRAAWSALSQTTSLAFGAIASKVWDETQSKSAVGMAPGVAPANVNWEESGYGAIKTPPTMDQPAQVGLFDSVKRALSPF